MFCVFFAAVEGVCSRKAGRSEQGRNGGRMQGSVEEGDKERMGRNDGGRAGGSTHQ